MVKTYDVKTRDEFVSAIEAARDGKCDRINIACNIVTEEPFEISGCDKLEITSENGSNLIGGIINGKWKREGSFLTFGAAVEPRILVINGRPVKKTSYPYDGYLENTDTCKHEWMNSKNGGWDSASTEYELTHITVRPQDIPNDFDVENCDIRVIHSWDESTVAVKSYDRDSGVVVCAKEMAHPAGAFEVHKYQFLNTKSGAPQKGRWHYDRREKKIFYCPSDGEDESNIESMIPISKSIIKISDSRNIKISNIKFKLSNSTPGEIAGLRAINPCGAIQTEDCENISLDMLEFGFSGGQGIKFLRSKNICVQNSMIENCAACGIVTFECEDEHIAYNTVSDIGLNDFSAVSVHAGGKSELVYVMDGCVEERGQTVIEYNTIDGSPYCGIVCSGGPHIIQNNKITNCMKVLRDGGAVYCSRANGTLIRGNYVSHICSDTAYSFYLDELSENCMIDGNVSVGVYIPFMSHIAKDCTVSNNLVVNNGETTVRMSRSEGFRWRSNLMISGGNVTFDTKSYIPGEKYSIGRCFEFCDNVISAPKIRTEPQEETDFEAVGVSNMHLDFTEENGRFTFENLPCEISNGYIVGRLEPHCVVTRIKPDMEERYQKLHSEIWDMVVKNGHLYNIRNYAIFKYLSFFEYVGDDFEADMRKKAELPVTKRWKKLCEECYEEIREVPQLIFFDRF